MRLMLSEWNLDRRLHLDPSCLRSVRLTSDCPRSSRMLSWLDSVDLSAEGDSSRSCVLWLRFRVACLASLCFPFILGHHPTP